MPIVGVGQNYKLSLRAQYKIFIVVKVTFEYDIENTTFPNGKLCCLVGAIP